MTADTAASIARVLLATVVGVLPVFLLGSLSVLIAQDLPLDGQRLGLVAATFWTTSTLFSWLAGQSADRIGPAWALGIGTMLSATAAGGIAASDGLGSLLASMAVGGVGNAFVVPGCNLAVARSLPSRRQGTAFGLKQAAVSSGVLVAGMLLPAAVAVGGWRPAFVMAGAVAVVSAGAMIRWRWRRRANTATGWSAGTVSMPRRGMVLLALATGMASATNTSLTTFCVISAVDGGRDATAAGALLSTGAALGIAAGLAIGRWADRAGGPGLREISALLALGALGFALLAWPTSPVTMLAGTILAFGAGWGWTGLYHLAVVRLRPRAPRPRRAPRRRRCSWAPSSGPWGFGTLASMTSFRMAWLAAGAWLLIAALGVHLTTPLLIYGEPE